MIPLSHVTIWKQAIMSTRQSQVFISYQRTDGDYARQVREHLVSHGVKTWMDQYDIQVGAYWPDAIDEGLNASDIVVGILSPEAMASRNVKNEWDWAIQNDKRLLLLQVKPTIIPHRYVSINFIDATGSDLTPALVQLLETLGIRRNTAPGTDIPTTRYARSGSVSVAYQVVGDGPVDFVWVPGFISHVEHQWTDPGISRFFQYIASFSRLILFDKRGTGLSDRISGVSTMEERMDDIRAVMDAAASERAVIFGLSEGVPLATLFAATYPDRTISLILWGAHAAAVSKPGYPWWKSYEECVQEIDALEMTIHETWGTIEAAEEALEVFGPSGLEDPVFVRWFATLLKLGASPGADIARQRMNLDLDIRHVLPTIRVPTLIIGRMGDRTVSAGEASYVADHILGAQLVEFPGDDHIPWLGDSQSSLDAIEAFVSGDDAVAASEPDRVLATVLVVEAVEDDGAASGMRLRDMARRELTRFRGREIVAAQDNVLATFDGPVRAVRCGAAIAAASQSVGIPVRVALHTGVIDLLDDSVSGPAVEIARQVLGVCEPGAVLISSTVKDLVAGSGIRFLDHGVHRTGSATDQLGLLAVDLASMA